VSLVFKNQRFAPSQVLPFSMAELSGGMQNDLNKSKAHLPLRGQHRHCVLNAPISQFHLACRKQTGHLSTVKTITLNQ
jgi:hypothetical protein